MCKWEALYINLSTQILENGTFSFCYILGSYEASHTYSGPVIPILMDYVKCSGSEVRLWDCPHFTHSYSGCSHSDDAGVRCQPGITHIESIWLGC